MRKILMAVLVTMGLGGAAAVPAAAQSCTGNPCSVSATYTASAGVGIVQFTAPAFLKLSISEAATVKTNARWVLQVATTDAPLSPGTLLGSHLDTTRVITGAPGLQQTRLHNEQQQGAGATAVVYTLAVR